MEEGCHHLLAQESPIGGISRLAVMPVRIVISRSTKRREEQEPTSGAALFELSAIRKSYRSAAGDVVVLHDLSLTISPGELCAITGPSGSGKTTLMNLLGLLDRPSGGRYLMDGTEVTGLPADRLADLRNRRIGFVFQSFHLLPRLTVLDNVGLPLMYRGVPRHRRRDLAKAALDRVGLGGRRQYMPEELSGGQRQRVAIARALVGNPQLILADEPTGNLDSGTAEDVMGVFRQLHRDGATVVIVTHDLAVAGHCQRRIVLLDGKVVQDAA